MEQYFTHASNSVADGFCETLVKTLMKYAPIALEKPDDYEARAEIMYACTFGCNGLLALGTGGSPSGHSQHPHGCWCPWSFPQR
jgi:alcohol dehydrogenase YqhD (iron-dependent ADH family)